MRTQHRYYARTPDGFEEHLNSKHAQESAEEALEDGGDGWHEETPATQWGLLIPLQHAVEINRREPTEMDPKDFDYLCEYELAPTPIVNIMEAVPEEHRPRVALTMLADLAAWVRNSPGDRVGDAADHLLVLIKQRYPEAV